MRNVEIQAAKEVAKKSFAIKSVEFEYISDVSDEEMFEIDPETFDVAAHMIAEYEGEPPESYRTLNAIVLDYVEEHRDELEKLLAASLIEHFEQEETLVDMGDFESDPTDFIWEEQVDYMPSIDPDQKKLHFTIELVMEVEELGEEG